MDLTLNPSKMETNELKSNNSEWFEHFEEKTSHIAAAFCGMNSYKQALKDDILNDPELSSVEKEYFIEKIDTVKPNS